MEWHSFDDKVICLDGTRQNFESGEYPKIRASISFNSLESRIDETYQPELLDTFKTLLGADTFYDASTDYGETDLKPYNE